MRAITFVYLLILSLVSTISAMAQAPVRPEVPQAVTVEEVQRFMDEYKTQFMKMDLDAFMDLFSKEAVENRTFPYADIREGYRKTFANSDSIQYRLEIYSIQAFQKNAFVRGRYELIQSLKKSKKKMVFRGDIQWDLIREDGLLKIRAVNYGRDLK